MWVKWMKTRNETRQNTRETRQTTIFSPKTAARRYSLASSYCNGTSTHFMLSMMCKHSKSVDFIVTIYGNGGCRTFLRVWRLHFSIAPVTQQRGRGNILRRYNVCFTVNFVLLMAFYILADMTDMTEFLETWRKALEERGMRISRPKNPIHGL